ncbi:MAG: GNAT family N-acetyltransferase [Burkholderiaceae bacterium]
MTLDYHTLTDQLARVYSPRLALRPVALSDAWPLFQATRNPQFNAHLMWDQPEDEGAVLARIDTIIDSARRGRLAALSAVIKSTGEWVSLYRFQPHAHAPSSVEMGIWTHDKFWQGHFSHELTAACVDAAFSLSNVSTLIAAAAPNNLGSCKILEKCGLTPASLVFRRTEAGTEVPLQEFCLTREHWKALRGAVSFEQVPFGGSPIDSLSPASAPPKPMRHSAPVNASISANTIAHALVFEQTGSALRSLQAT